MLASLLALAAAPALPPLPPVILTPEDLAPEVPGLRLERGACPCLTCEGRGALPPYPWDRPGAAGPGCKHCGGTGRLDGVRTAGGVLVPVTSSGTGQPAHWAGTWERYQRERAAAGVGHDAAYLEWIKVRPRGFGSWRLGRGYLDREHGYRVRPWIHVSPDGGMNHTTLYTREHREPPPLAKPERERRTCGCHEGAHVCSACGLPHFVEIHGCAAGYCTACHYSG